MAVMRNSIIFGGVNSADFGIYISGEGVFNAPKRAVEYVQVPGRSGAIAMDLGYYENIEVEYPAFNYEPEMADFIQALRSFRNAICSQTGYQRLSDTFHPDEYRMAVYSEGLEVDPVKFNTASEFTLKFNCKPQRYLLSGESAQSMGEWGDTETVTGDIVTVENPDGLLAVKSLSVSLEPIQSGSGTPSSDNVRPISGRDEVDVIVSPTTSASEGNTYTTSLGQTVYGGTLDVVSGELTVTHGISAVSDLTAGSFATGTVTCSKVFYLSPIANTATTSTKHGAVSNMGIEGNSYFASNRTSEADSANIGFAISTDGTYMRVYDTDLTLTTSTFSTKYASMQICYPLATPTTVQLTPQEIELLTGTNHLWSGGEVTVEYGDDPAILYNPTPFDASPLLEVEGYGSIEFNGYTIEIDEGFYGIVDVADAGAIPTDTVLQTEMFNDGDTVTIKPFTVNCHFGDDTYPFESPQVTNTSGIGTTAYASGSGTKNLHFKTTFAAITFASNTDYSSETKATLKATLNRSPLFSPPQAEDITININYTASTHTVSITVSSSPNPDQLITPEIFAFDNPSWNGATADSTKSTMTGTTYIDCDLGDAYKIEDGEYASLNSYIDLGSDLPTLASGANEVVLSSTITSLKIIPRWWIL